VRPRFGQLFKSSARWTWKARTNQITFPLRFQGGRGGFVVAATRAASSELLTYFEFASFAMGFGVWLDDKSNPVCMMGQLGFGL
jgi:hypothetical protein